MTIEGIIPWEVAKYGSIEHISSFRELQKLNKDTVNLKAVLFSDVDSRTLESLFDSVFHDDRFLTFEGGLFEDNGVGNFQLNEVGRMVLNEIRDTFKEKIVYSDPTLNLDFIQRDGDNEFCTYEITDDSIDYKYVNDLITKFTYENSELEER